MRLLRNLSRVCDEPESGQGLTMDGAAHLTTGRV